MAIDKRSTGKIKHEFNYKKQSILVQKKIKRINVLNENAFEVVFDENNVPFRISREPDLSSQGKITVIDAPLPVVYKNNFLKNPSENLFFSKIFKGINFLRKSFLKHVLRIDITSNSFDDITKREFIYDGYEFKYDDRAIFYAKENNNIDVLEWFKNNGYY